MAFCKVTVQNNNRDKQTTIKWRNCVRARGDRPVFCNWNSYVITRRRRRDGQKITLAGKEAPPKEISPSHSSPNFTRSRLVLISRRNDERGEELVPLMFVSQRSIMYLIALELLCERSIDQCLTSETATILTYPFVLHVTTRTIAPDHSQETGWLATYL